MKSPGLLKQKQKLQHKSIIVVIQPPFWQTPVSGWAGFQGTSFKQLKNKTMSKRSYKEAVEITVNWWVEKSFATPLNQNNGDNSDNGGFGFLLMNMVAGNAQKEVTDDKIEKFKAGQIERQRRKGTSSNGIRFEKLKTKTITWN